MPETPTSAHAPIPVSSRTLSIIGVLCAIAATTTMDATGLGAFSALALAPLLFLFWYLNRLSRAQVGFRLGRWRDYGLALLYPVAVMGAITLIAQVAGAIDTTHTNWHKVQINLALMTISTFLVAIVTEEGFFRGWLWGSLQNAGMRETSVLIWTSIAFALWHISAITLDADFKPSASQIPIFLVNAAVVGAVWGVLRALSGSVLVASLSHGLWNGIAYVFFGFGTKLGALGITKTAIFGPEIGLLGLGLNLIFAFLLWRWWIARQTASDESRSDLAREPLP
jgi:membrane protease YdiL (CAAX protease family)